MSLVGVSDGLPMFPVVPGCVTGASSEHVKFEDGTVPGREGLQESVRSWLFDKLRDERQTVLRQLGNRHSEILHGLASLFDAHRRVPPLLNSKTWSATLPLATASSLDEPTECQGKPLQKYVWEAASVLPVDLKEHYDSDVAMVEAKTLQSPGGALVTDLEAANLSSSTDSEARHSELSSDVPTRSSVGRLSKFTLGNMDNLLYSLNGPSRESLLTDPSPFVNMTSFIKSQRFELICVSAIVFNAFLMAAKLQYEGIDAGYKLRVRTYDAPAASTWPYAAAVFQGMDIIFLVAFILELVLRLFAYRLRWFCSFWNYLDATVLGIALSRFFISEFSEWNPLIVRLTRFSKLVRITRVMRSNKLLESLKLLVASIQASYNTLCISLFVLLVIQSVAGMLLSQLVEPYINDEQNPEELRREVFLYYGSFWRCMVTMFELTFANWAPTCRLLLDNVSEWFGIFFVLYRCIVGFALMSVIQAVFIQQTMKTAQLDDDFLIQQKTREKKMLADKLLKIFRKLDKSGDGFVSWNEFETLLSDARMKLLMSSLELDVRDLSTLFKLLDDGDEQISPEEFVDGLQRMKGNAKALDLIALTKAVQRVEARLDGVVHLT